MAVSSFAILQNYRELSLSLNYLFARVLPSSINPLFESGAANWNASKKETFANDRRNHVASCGRVNSSKGSTAPKDFLRRSSDGKGLDYEIVSWCDYVSRYWAVKSAYQLSTANNKMRLLVPCRMLPNASPETD